MGGVSILLILSLLICVIFPNDWTFYQSSNYVAEFDVLHIIIVLVRYICYGGVTFTALLTLFIIYDAIKEKRNELVNSICQIGRDETLFLYLAHISLLYYTLRVFVLDNESALISSLENQVIRSYIVSIVVAALLVVVLTILYKFLSRSVITKKIFIGE